MRVITGFCVTRRQGSDKMVWRCGVPPYSGHGVSVPKETSEPVSGGIASPLNADVTGVLNAAERGDPQVAQRLLDALYDELRELPRARMAREAGGGGGMTLHATALVHETYLRVVGSGEDGRPPQVWQNRGHFF